MTRDEAITPLLYDGDIIKPDGTVIIVNGIVDLTKEYPDLEPCLMNGRVDNDE